MFNPLSANHECSRRHLKILFHCFSEKIRLDVSSESSARPRIHIKHQALFSSKDESKKLKCRLLQFLFGALGVKNYVVVDKPTHRDSCEFWVRFKAVCVVSPTFCGVHLIVWLPVTVFITFSDSKT